MTSALAHGRVLPSAQLRGVHTSARALGAVFAQSAREGEPHGARIPVSSPHLPQPRNNELTREGSGLDVEAIDHLTMLDAAIPKAVAYFTSLAE